MKNKVPNPGSDEAVKIGCLCGRLDNNFGRGYYEDGKTFVYRLDCPIHKDMETKNPD
jgi:hypothetical protein